MAKDRETIDISIPDYLAPHGIEITGYNGPSSLVGKDKEGNEVDIDVNAIQASIADQLRSQGEDTSKLKFNVTTNTPETAFNVAPEKLAVGDRAKLELGNDKGRINYLKNKFEDVRIDENNGLVVKENGAWKKVDPSSSLSDYIKDPWEAARDLEDLIPLSVQVTAGAAPIVATGGASIPVAGAIAGATKAGLSSLGRYFGTYDATPQEQAVDISIDTLLGATGQAVALGVKPTLKMIGNALYKTKALGEATKDTVISAMGKLSGVKEPVTRVMTEDPKAWTTAFEKASKEAANSADIISNAGKAQIESINSLVNEADDAIKAQYGKELKNLIESAGDKSISVNFTNVAEQAAKDMEAKGLGQAIKTKSGWQIQPFAEDVLKSRLQENLPARAIDEALYPKLNAFLAEPQRFSSAEGKAAAGILQGINSRINQLSKASSTLDDASKAAITEASNSIKTGIGGEFSRNGLGEQFQAMQKGYSKFKNFIKESKRAITNGDPQTFINKLVSDSGKNLTTKDETQQLVKLLGDRGQQLYKDIMVNEAVKGYAPIAPKLGLTNLALAAASLTKGPAGFATAAAASSPRLAGKAIRANSIADEALYGLGQKIGYNSAKIVNDVPLLRYAAETANFLGSQGSKVLKNQEVINSALRAGFLANELESADLKALINQIPPPQGQEPQQ